MSRTVTILLAEDDENDVFLFRRALQKAKLAPQLFHVADGQEAVDYLSGQSPYTDRKQFPFPDIVLLDLKMPRMGGFEVLEWLNTRSDLMRMPVIVFSSSNHDRDREQARLLGAADYHCKPGDPAELERFVCRLFAEWLSEVRTADS